MKGKDGKKLHWTNYFWNLGDEEDILFFFFFFVMVIGDQRPSTSLVKWVLLDWSGFSGRQDLIQYQRKVGQSSLVSVAKRSTVESNLGLSKKGRIKIKISKVRLLFSFEGRPKTKSVLNSPYQKVWYRGCTKSNFHFNHTKGRFFQDTIRKKI